MAESCDGRRAAGGRGVLEGAFSLMEVLAELNEAGLSTVAATSGLPKATAHRLLEQLRELGVVERRGDQYRIGYRAFALGQAWQAYPGLREAARAPMRALARATGASVAVCVLRTGRAVVASGVTGELGMKVPVAAGTCVPWPTAAGKILVAADGALTPVALGSGGWCRQAAMIREQGVALDREEVTAGVCCVAVPVRGPDGEPIAALAAMTVPTAPLQRLAEGVRRAGEAVSATLRAR